MSTQQYNLSRPDLAHFVGLRNYGQLLRTISSGKRSASRSSSPSRCSALQFVIGFFIANLFDRERRGMNLLRTLFIIPVFASPVALGLTWRYMYQPGYGLINYLLESVGLPRVNWLASTEWALPAVIAVDVWQWTPFVALILLAGMQSISPEITEAAELDGLTPLPVPVADRLAAPDADHRRRRADPAHRRAEDVRSDLHHHPRRTGHDHLHAAAARLREGFASFLMGPSAAIAWVVVIVVNICATIFLWLLAREQA